MTNVFLYCIIILYKSNRKRSDVFNETYNKIPLHSRTYTSLDFKNRTARRHFAVNLHHILPDLNSARRLIIHNKRAAFHAGVRINVACNPVRRSGGVRSGQP